ncbi:MAG: pyridoxal phosphate-dependent aminotransferase [Ignavibacteriota bacterium]|nr:pyridoxal phosphate-dependent aminotransferase [Ignavibacteriota bacterium]
MFSKRLNIEYEANELSLLYNLKTKHGERILDLTSSNPTKLNFKYDAKHILKHFIDDRSLVYEPDPKGMISAREEVAKYYSGVGKTVSADDLFLVPSTSEAYSYLFKLLLDAEDEVLMPQPSYPLFEYLTRLDLGNVVYYPLVYDYRDGWVPDFALLEKKISPKTKAIVIINPNNPTGSYIRESDYEAFNNLSEKYNLALIVDEVFSDYEIEAGDKALKTVAGFNSNLTFVLNGFSKMLALPQMKFGWILIQGGKKLKDEAVQRLEVIADTYLSVATPVQFAVKRLFETREKIQEEISGRINKNYNLLKKEFLLNPDIKVLNCEGGWNAILNFENLLVPEDEFVLKLLDKKNVLIHPGYYYDFFTEGFAVISLLTETDVMEKAIELING